VTVIVGHLVLKNGING